MQVQWTYKFEHIDSDSPNSNEAPLFWDGQHILLPLSEFEHDRQTRAADPSTRGYLVRLFRFDRQGQASSVSFRTPKTLLPRAWSFLRLGDEVLLHTGSFHSLPNCEPVALPYVDAADAVGPGVFLQDGTGLYFVGRNATLHAYEVPSKTHRWTLELPNAHRYPVGPVAIRDSHLVCYGRDHLNYIEPRTGDIHRQVAFPRIDRLYPPIEHDGNLIFPYTNWTSGGLLCVDPHDSTVVWRFRTRGRVAVARGAPLPVVNGLAIVSVNDGSSLVAVDLTTGQLRWSFRAQWLYTPIEVVGGSLIFGTAGGYGRHLRRHNAETGETEWAVQMNGGCPYYSSDGEHILAGDWKGILRRVDKDSGAVIDEINLRSPIQSAPLILGEQVFALTWPTTEDPPALVALH